MLIAKHILLALMAFGLGISAYHLLAPIIQVNLEEGNYDEI